MNIIMTERFTQKIKNFVVLNYTSILLQRTQSVLIGRMPLLKLFLMTRYQYFPGRSHGDNCQEAIQLHLINITFKLLGKWDLATKPSLRADDCGFKGQNQVRIPLRFGYKCPQFMRKTRTFQIILLHSVISLIDTQAQRASLMFTKKYLCYRQIEDQL